MKVRLNTLIKDLPGTVYHAVPNSYSSSQLKDMIDDEELFFKKYIEKSIPRQSNSAFDVGTYFHTGILEPEKLAEECIVYRGAVRRGAEYEAFVAKHPDKVIVTAKEKDTAENLMAAVNSSPVARDLLRTCSAEVSLFVKLYVTQDQIYSRTKGKWRWLDNSIWNGFISLGADFIPPEGGVEIIMKVRADAIDAERGYIIDLKSTTGNAKNERTIRGKISAFKYDLSAALYLDIFSLAFDKPVDKFYWTFASKDYRNSRTWLASKDNIMIGRAKWSKAVLKLAELMRNDWKFVDCLGIAEPEYYERDWITQQKGNG